MDSRERFFLTVNHQQPDRPPFNARLCAKLKSEISAEMPAGVDYRNFYHEDIFFLGFDRWNYDDFMAVYGNLPDTESVLGMRENVSAMKSKGIITCNSYIPGVYEHVKEVTGTEQALIGMFEEPEKLQKIIDDTFTWLVKVHEAHASAGLDIVWIGDDLGTQQSLIMSLDNYRAFYKPYHKELVKAIKKANPDAKVAFHCCGHVTPLLPDLIDVGIDILETVQPEANNDRAFLKKEYGRDICFWGAIGMQSVFYGKTPRQVSDEVKKAIEIMSDGGGYITAPCHTVTEEMPAENVKAFYETVNGRM